MPRYEELPDDLIKAVRERRCAIFVGAGFSQSLGFPTWQELLVRIKRRIREKKRGHCRGLDQLSPLQLVQYFIDLCEEAREPLNELLSQSFPKTKPGYAPQHLTLTRLPVKEVLTTNWDEAIEKAFDDAKITHKRIFRETQARAWDQTTHVIKLHGTISDPDSIVFAEYDYAAYEKDHERLELIVRTILATREVLFLGFSLRDPNFQRLFSQRYNVPKRYRQPVYAVLFGEPNAVVDYWCNRGVTVITPPYTKDLTAGLQATMNKLVDQTTLCARSNEERIRLLIRELKRFRDQAGPKLTIRIKAAFGPFGSPKPGSYRIFSRPGDTSREAKAHDRKEWEVRRLIEQYLQAGAALKQFCGGEVQSLRKRYSKRQATARLQSLINGIEQYPSSMFVYKPSEVQRNYVIIGDYCLIESYHQQQFGARLYDAAEVTTDPDLVDSAIQRFDREYATVRDENLRAAQRLRRNADTTDEQRLRGYVLARIRQQLAAVDRS